MIYSALVTCIAVSLGASHSQLDDNTMRLRNRQARIEKAKANQEDMDYPRVNLANS